MKKNAWTLAEMAIAFSIIIILTGLCINKFKPNVQKAKFYLYAAVKNINQGNISIIDKGNNLDAKDLLGSGDTAQDWYCVNLADAFALESSPNCLRSANDSDVNIMFPNGTTVKGLAKSWKVPNAKSKVKYKNILIDIDGSSGVNRIGADQFPMRIIAGSGKGTQGLVVPVNCASDKIINPDNGNLVDVDTDAKNQYCPGSGGKDYTTDDEVLTYDIYRATNAEAASKVKIIASGLSHKQADCMAHGSSVGYYSVKECDTNPKFRIKAECATQESCKTCTSNTCPEGTGTCASKATASNPKDLQCLTLMHKPSGGVSFIIQALVGDVSEI